MWGTRSSEAGRLLGIGADQPTLTFDYPDPDGPSATYWTEGWDGVAEYRFPALHDVIGDEPDMWIDDYVTPAGSSAGPGVTTKGFAPWR